MSCLGRGLALERVNVIARLLVLIRVIDQGLSARITRARVPCICRVRVRRHVGDRIIAVCSCSWPLSWSYKWPNGFASGFTLQPSASVMHVVPSSDCSRIT